MGLLYFYTNRCTKVLTKVSILPQWHSQVVVVLYLFIHFLSAGATQFPTLSVSVHAVWVSHTLSVAD